MGIDYAAPTGTPIVSIGDGVVVFKGWKRGFGNCIEIRHNSIYTTSYGHLAKFAKGIRKGIKVKQKDLIGYVGMTGLATGPHLDFRIQRYEEYINFLKLKFPPATFIKEDEISMFKKIKEDGLIQLAQIR